MEYPAKVFSSVGIPASIYEQEYIHLWRGPNAISRPVPPVAEQSGVSGLWPMYRAEVHRASPCLAAGPACPSKAGAVPHFADRIVAESERFALQKTEPPRPPS